MTITTGRTSDELLSKKNPRRFFFLSLVLLLTVIFARADSTPSVPSLTQPEVVIDLVKFGWTPPREISNKEYFKNFSLAKLEADDPNTKLVFVSDKVLVAYHMRPQPGLDWGIGGELEAFFIQTSDGSLLSKKQWATSPRKDILDSSDTEARIIPLSAGRFLVHANGKLLLYSSDLGLLREWTLEPAGPTDYWAAQSASGGRYVFLRHGSRSGEATYFWLDADTLEPTEQQVTSSLWVPVAMENGMIGGSPSGLQMIRFGQPAKVICDDPSCHEVLLRAVSTSQVALKRRNGIGVLDIERGLLWSDSIELQQAPEFGSLRTAASGRRFAFWVIAVKHPWFHGVKIASPAIFIYDSSNPKPLFTLRLKSLKGQFDFALSPNGKRVAVFDANGVRIFRLD